jgi:hypothetical protein
LYKHGAKGGGGFYAYREYLKGSPDLYRTYLTRTNVVIRVYGYTAVRRNAHTIVDDVKRKPG